ncbi:hypothetical protein V6Z11_A10G149500 [Gossypium hirsutum]|uniref:Protein RALF-like 24 isoform X2 n=1 Tax=Gossypium hirsutum TaxID=3635 RepID=A0A1U8KB74_GOSHI|nr:protein RALF-like 24 isoform X2 [Gossypium hirsutum]
MPTFNFKFIFISIFLSLLFLHTCNSVSILDLDSALASSEIDARARRVCTKKLEDCLEEEEMESESNRRVLVMQRKYISYETLRRDMVPCATPGASYYDCNGGHQANHYNRGCEVITRCARGIKVFTSVEFKVIELILLQHIHIINDSLRTI